MEAGRVASVQPWAEVTCAGAERLDVLEGNDPASARAPATARSESPLPGPLTSSTHGVQLLQERDLEAQQPRGQRRRWHPASLVPRKSVLATGAVVGALLLGGMLGGFLGTRSAHRAQPADAAHPIVPTSTSISTSTSTSTSAVAQPTGPIHFSVYKDVWTNTFGSTNAISTRVTGTHATVVDALPEVDTVRWAFARGDCGHETWGSEQWGRVSGDAMSRDNVEAWAEAGKRYVISTGGAGGTFKCESDEDFSTFLDRYMSSAFAGVDFDLESGEPASEIEDLVARVRAAKSDPRYAHLRFTFTVGTGGSSIQQNLGATGHAVVAALKRAGLTDVPVNLMTMVYGAAHERACTLGDDGRCDMGASAVAAAKSLHVYEGLPYAQIEVTPMLGGNDVIEEVFTLDDVDTVARFANEVGLGGVHLWSIDRDTDCARGPVSPTCNTYGEAGTLGFTHAFQRALRGAV